jgi:hypothetical protein
MGVLVRDGEAVQRADLRAGGERRVGGVGRGSRTVGVQGDDGVQRRVDPVDAVQVGVEQLARRDLPSPDQAGQLRRRPEAELVVHERQGATPRLCMVMHGNA